MPRPCSEELRARVVSAYHNGEGTQRELAVRFCVDRSSVMRWLKLKQETGALQARPRGGARHERKVSAEGEAFLREVLSDVPDSTIAELVVAYEGEFGVKMDDRTMGRALARMGYTKKKGRSGRRKRTDPTSKRNEKRSSAK
jgi:transposase